MKEKIILIFCFITLIFTHLLSQQNDYSKLTLPYLGQNPPGLEHEVFASGIVNTKLGVYRNIVFSPDLKEACWTQNSGDTTQYRGGFITTRYIDGEWNPPTEIRFMNNKYNQRSPFYSMDGGRLYFQSHLKADQGWDQFEKFYFVEKINNEWSKPVLLDTIFNKYSIHWQFSLDKAKNLYFGGELRGSENSGGIYYSKFINGVYAEPLLIFSNQDYGEAVFGPAISPNDDYILFARIHPRGFTNPRIFSITLALEKVHQNGKNLRNLEKNY